MGMSWGYGYKCVGCLFHTTPGLFHWHTNRCFHKNYSLLFEILLAHDMPCTLQKTRMAKVSRHAVADI